MALDNCQSVKIKMSSPDDTISIINNNFIGYNNSEWKPLTFTLVEYPRGKVEFVHVNNLYEKNCYNS